MEILKKMILQLSANNNSYITSLARSYPLRKEILVSSISLPELQFHGSGIDVGCGIGLTTLLLADTIGPDARVTGVDISDKFLQRAETIAQKAELSNRVDFKKGNASDLPFEDNHFDWAFSVDCINYAPGDSHAQVNELKRVVRHGGTVALLGWSSQQLLPGFPELEAKLDSTKEGIAPFTKNMKPDRHFLKTGKLFKELGLKKIRAKTFIRDIFAPLDYDIYNALNDLIKMRWPCKPSILSEKELELYKYLTNSDSPGFILNDPDYYGFFTYTMFFATK